MSLQRTIVLLRMDTFSSLVKFDSLFPRYKAGDFLYLLVFGLEAGADEEYNHGDNGSENEESEAKSF